MRASQSTMTEGNISRALISFSIPAMLGNLFQVTYNTVDAIVVGKYAGPAALAAVGIAAPLMNIAMFFMVGLGMGASVIMSEFYGAKKHDSLRREFSTAIISAVCFSLVIAIAYLVFTRPLLTLCNTPSEILDDASAYLRIVALGMPFSCAYNLLSSSCRSVGDTCMPLLCLVCGAVANILLDLWFVAGLQWKVAGAALATIISQVLSAALCGTLLFCTAPLFRMKRKEFRPDRQLFRRTIRYSYASALQQAGVYIGKLLIQSMINPLGVDTIAAFNAVNRIDDYALIPERDLASAVTVCTAQNHGAGNSERVTRGFRIGIWMGTAYGVLISIAVILLPGPLMRLFVAEKETEVIRLGTRYLSMMGWFYFLPGLTNILQGYMRGLGKMRITMYATYIQMAVRALVTALFVKQLKLDIVPPACVCGWVVMTVMEFWLVIRGRKQDA